MWWVNALVLPLFNLPYTILFFGNFSYFDRYLIQPHKKHSSWTTRAWFKALGQAVFNTTVGYFVLLVMAPLTIAVR